MTNSESPLEPIPLNKALQSHGNDTLAPPTTPQAASASRQNLTPGDCRTLKKLLKGVRTPSSAVSESDEGLLTPDGSSDPGAEDAVHVADGKYEVGDEREGGYEDEDGSMDLSADEMLATDIGASALSSDGSDGGVAIGDVMNMTGKQAPTAPGLELDGLDVHRKPENAEIEARRAELEELVKEERLAQEQERAEAVAQDDGFGPDADSGEEDDAVALSDDPEFKALEAFQAETGVSVANEADEAIIELEVCHSFIA